ncbi:MAG: nicotinate (nicotinamide) nucleotide adenylyltransferase [Magnetococcales bacterium]|nr:nicotinate (nicotinamide) nucleotide adenylyltransferase [Magnetococcales bacterium]
MSRLIGILGGSFNPPHFGHLRPAREAMAWLGLEKMVFLPSGEHPLKKNGDLALASHRLAMIKAAVADEPRFEVSDLDVRHPGISYTVETLERLAPIYPDRELVFLVGADILRELPFWKDWRGIFERAHLAVMARPGTDLNFSNPDLTGPLDRQVADFLLTIQVDCPEQLNRSSSGAYGFIRLPITPLDISSTQIRTLIKNGEGSARLMPAGVRDYINRNRLYLSESKHG